MRQQNTSSSDQSSDYSLT